jgi:hypothetical protein
MRVERNTSALANDDQINEQYDSFAKFTLLLLHDCILHKCQVNARYVISVGGSVLVPIEGYLHYRQSCTTTTEDGSLDAWLRGCQTGTRLTIDTLAGTSVTPHTAMTYSILPPSAVALFFKVTKTDAQLAAV